MTKKVSTSKKATTSLNHKQCMDEWDTFYQWTKKDSFKDMCWFSGYEDINLNGRSVNLLTGDWNLKTKPISFPFESMKIASTTSGMNC